MKKWLSVLLVFSFLLTLAPWGVIFALQGNADSPYFDRFGTQISLAGNWTVTQEPGVGTVMTSDESFSAQLDNLIKDMVLDLDFKLPVDTAETFSLVMRQPGGNTYWLKVGKDGLSLEGLTETPYSDTTVPAADNCWHSLRIAMQDKRIALWYDGIKIKDAVWRRFRFRSAFAGGNRRRHILCQYKPVLCRGRDI